MSVPGGVSAKIEAPFNMSRSWMCVKEGFALSLIQTARKTLILNGEMSEWLKEHAWKTTPARLTERHQNTSSRNQFNDLPL